MTKHEKKYNWQLGTAALEQLVAEDYQVHPFSDIHFRINWRLDVWPSTRKYYDTRTHQKGEYRDLKTFVKSHLPQK